MRKRGQVIRDKRLRFKKGFQKKFIEEVKNKSGFSWKKLGHILGVSDYTLRIDWCKEKRTIPLRTVKKILKKFDMGSFENIKSEYIDEVLEKNWGQIKGGGKNIKEINTPKEDEKIAELLGVILGDGHLYHCELTITGNYHERAHHMYIGGIIKDSFGLGYKSFRNKNTTILDVYSKNLIKYLVHNGLKIGNKIKNGASLPQWVFRKKEYTYGALRGLFDTDGGIFAKEKNYKRAIIEFQTHSPHIRANIMNLLKKGGFTSSKSLGNVRIQNQEEIKKFFELVGSSNPKNVVRYKYFLRTGFIPKKEKLMRETVNFGGSLPYKRL